MTTVADTSYSFALCLTHDVDKPFKTPSHALFYGLTERNLDHLRSLSGDENPYWQFDDIMALEDKLDVRSAFYFLNEQPLSAHSLSDVLDPEALLQTVGRYDVRNPAIADIIRRLDEGGWEVGLHGSYHTACDYKRLREESRRIESVLGHDIVGGRQHYLNLSVPETWYHHRDIGLKYDASLGLPTECGFQFGYDVQRPFDDDFVVFPLTLMEQHLPDPGSDFQAAWSVCESLLETAASENAVMTVLFHPRFFSEQDFPGYRRLYRRLIERASELGAWVGPPGEFYKTHLAKQPHTV